MTNEGSGRFSRTPFLRLYELESYPAVQLIWRGPCLSVHVEHLPSNKMMDRRVRFFERRREALVVKSGVCQAVAWCQIEQAPTAQVGAWSRARQESRSGE